MDKNHNQDDLSKKNPENNNTDYNDKLKKALLENNITDTKDSLKELKNKLEEQKKNSSNQENNSSLNKWLDNNTIQKITESIKRSENNESTEKNETNEKFTAGKNNDNIPINTKTSWFFKNRFSNIFKKSQDPKNLAENIVYWAIAWSLYSIEKIVEIIYKLAKDLVNIVPYIRENKANIIEQIKKI